MRTIAGIATRPATDLDVRTVRIVCMSTAPAPNVFIAVAPEWGWVVRTAMIENTTGWDEL